MIAELIITGARDDLILYSKSYINHLGATNRRSLRLLPWPLSFLHNQNGTEQNRDDPRTLMDLSSTCVDPVRGDSIVIITHHHRSG